MQTFNLGNERYLIPPGFFQPHTNEQTTESYEARKREIIQKLHVLPLKVYYTKETLQSWDLPKLYRQMKLNGDERKFDPTGKTKEEIVDFVYSYGEVGNISSDHDDCGICVEEYEDEDVVRLLACNHAFHVDCIDRWALNSCAKSAPPKCPMCNAQI